MILQAYASLGYIAVGVDARNHGDRGHTPHAYANVRSIMLPACFQGWYSVLLIILLSRTYLHKKTKRTGIRMVGQGSLSFEVIISFAVCQYLDLLSILTGTSCCMEDWRRNAFLV